MELSDYFVSPSMGLVRCKPHWFFYLQCDRVSQMPDGLLVLI